MQSTGHYLIAELGSGVSVELYAGVAKELSIELDPVVSGVVIVEQTWLDYRRP